MEVKKSVSETACDGCGKVYNRYLKDRFWFGVWFINGTIMNTLCNDCHRDHIRES